LSGPSVHLICHYFVVLLSSVLMVASIDGHLPFLAACHCSSLLLLKIVIVLIYLANKLSLSLSLTVSLPSRVLGRKVEKFGVFFLKSVCFWESWVLRSGGAVAPSAPWLPLCTQLHTVIRLYSRAIRRSRLTRYH